MKVIVTGANGFIGREIVKVLAEADWEVTAVVRNPPSAQQNPFAEYNNVRFIKADITAENGLAELLKTERTDALIHSAGLAHQFGETKKEEFEAVNVRGTAKVAGAAVKLAAQHFILIGSTAVYGSVQPTPPNTAIDEETALRPSNDYARSKSAGENVCREICEAHQMPLTIFRLAPVIGEANVGNVARLIKTVDSGRFRWLGDGKNLKTLIYKRDVALACRVLLEKKSGGTEIFNLAAAPISMNEFVNQIALRLGKKVSGWRIPAGLPGFFFRLNADYLRLSKIQKIAAVVEKWLADDVYSAEKIRRRYGFSPATDISEALQRQVNRYLKNSRR